MRRESGREYYGAAYRDGAYLIGDDTYSNAEEYSSMVQSEENVSAVYRGRGRGRGNHGYRRRRRGRNYAYNNDNQWNDWDY